MYIFLIIIHVLVCFLMVGAILLQSGKGAEIGASFGGSSQTVFGSRGPANFLSKFTVVVAAVFMLTSLEPGYSRQRTNVFFHSHRSQKERDVLRPPPKPHPLRRQPQPAESHTPSDSSSSGH